MWSGAIQMDYSDVVTLFKSRRITSNIVLVCEFHLETQTIVQALLLFTKNTEWNQVSRTLGIWEEYFENSSKYLMDSNRSVWASIYDEWKCSNKRVGREEEETKEKNTGRNRPSFPGKRPLLWQWEQGREEFLVLHWEKPQMHEVDIRILALKPSSPDPLHKMEQSSSSLIGLFFTEWAITQLLSFMSTVRTSWGFISCMAVGCHDSTESLIPVKMGIIIIGWTKKRFLKTTHKFKMLHAAYRGEQRSELCCEEVSFANAGRNTKIEIWAVAHSQFYAICIEYKLYHHIHL